MLRSLILRLSKIHRILILVTIIVSILSTGVSSASEKFPNEIQAVLSGLLELSSYIFY